MHDHATPVITSTKSEENTKTAIEATPLRVFCGTHKRNRHHEALEAA